MFTPSSKAFPLALGLALLIVMLFLLGAALLWLSYRSADAKRISARLQVLTLRAQADGEVRRQQSSGSGARPVIETWFLALPWMRMTAQRLQQAGLRWSVKQLFLVSAMCGVSGTAMIGLVMQRSIAIAIGVGTLLACGPVAYVYYRRKQRLQRLARQLPEMLSYLARYLRTGGSLPVGLQMIGDKLAEPIAGEFRVVHDEINFGLPVQQALANLAGRVPDTDLRNFVIALTINSETGGNIIEVLNNLSRLIRERQKLADKVKVLASDGIFAAWLLVCMPFVLVAALSVVAPKWIAVLWNDAGALSMVQWALALMALGIFLIRKITRIRV